MTSLVSCICPTYGRPPDYQHLLEEAIESFLRQDYEDKELIVLNDAPTQELVCDAPDVRVINLTRRSTSLGAKYNTAIRLSRGMLICPWEDDDISLPWRISASVELLGDDDYCNPRRYWFIDSAGLHHEHPMGYSHNCSIYRLWAWATVDGYPDISGPQDAAMDGRLRASCKVADMPVLPIDRWWYIYRWGVSPTHLSSRGDTERFYREVGAQPVESGEFQLRPHWKQDYTAMCQAVIKDNDHGYQIQT